jgi:hypothetical protein
MLSWPLAEIFKLKNKGQKGVKQRLTKDHFFIFCPLRIYKTGASFTKLTYIFDKSFGNFLL